MEEITNDLDKKYYRIKDVAEILGIPASTLRFWESEFKIIKPTRTAHNIRLYTPADVEVIRLVHYLVKEKGMKLDAAQAEIKRNRQNVAQRLSVIDRLKEIRAKLVDWQNALNSMQ
ncbi:MAG: MerR family transcriptional regulator [Muribaculaceae bacterium]|nr:MerR family transcriptional regulator [Muribaculaceae bacterium]